MTYITDSNVSGSYYGLTPQAPDPDAANVITSQSSVVYNDVLDPATGQPLQAHYTCKGVKQDQVIINPLVPPSPIYVGRLVWASDPMFAGPLKQVRYIYRDSTDDMTKTTVLEERYASSFDPVNNPGTMVNRIQMQPYTFGNGGPTEGYYTRIHTRGDGAVRTISYWNKDTQYTYFDSQSHLQHGVGRGQILMDHITDWTNNPNLIERLEYDWTNYFQTPIKITDMRGNVTTQTLEPVMGKITKITWPDGSSKSWTYTDSSNPIYVASHTDERGKVTTYTRDPVTHLITGITHPDGATEGFTYNSFKQLTRHQRANGAYEHFVYDGRGLLLQKYNPTYNASPQTTDPYTLYSYYPPTSNWADRVMKETMPANVSGYSASETYQYDGTGNAHGRGLVTRMTHADNNFRTVTYGNYGEKLTETNELNQTTRYAYDSYFRPLRVTDPLLHFTTYSYENATGVGSTSPLVNVTSNVRFATDPAGVVTANTYDINYRKATTTAAYGTSVAAATSVTYDAVGNPLTVTDPLGHVAATTYDSRNRKAAVTAASGTSLAQTTTFTYDPASNVTNVLRPDGKNEVKTYDAMNRVANATIPIRSGLNQTTNFSYWPSGMLKEVNDAYGRVTRFNYDAADHKTQMVYPDDTNRDMPATDYEQWNYDNAFNLKSRRTVNGTTQNFTFDNRNRSRGFIWSNGADYANLGYDAASRLASAINANSTVTRQYDAAGRLTHDTQAVGGAGFTYDLIYNYDQGAGNTGRLTELTVANGATYHAQYSYDAMGRLQNVSPVGGNGFQYGYDAASNIMQRVTTLAGNTTLTYGARDALNRLPSRTITHGSTTVSSESYAYDNMNRLGTVQRSEDGKSDQFGYDYASELVSAQYGLVGGVNPNRSVNYTLDLVGNRNIVTDGGVNSNYAPNALNQYTGSVGTAPITNGSEHEIATYLGVAYQYINDGHLTHITSGANVYDIKYDALGRAVKRTLNQATTYYFYDGEKAINETGATLASNFYGAGIDEIVIRFTPSAVYYFYQDHEGSVTHVLDGNASVFETYRYDAFGQPTIKNWAGTVLTTSAINNRFMFTGREWAPVNLGFYEYRARAYHPGLGRFMSEDPKGFDAGDYNLFRYCGNDPEDKTDPMGLQSAGDAAELAAQRMRAMSAAERFGMMELADQTSLQGNAAAAMVNAYNNNPNGGSSAWRGSGNVTIAQMSRTTSGKSFEQRADGDALRMLAQETHRPADTQTGLITSGPPGRIGPIGETVGPSDPMNLESKRQAREVMPPVPKGQEALIIHYHSRTGPREGPPSDTDLTRVKAWTMYFTNRDLAKTGEYLIYRRGQSQPEIHQSDSIIP